MKKRFTKRQERRLLKLKRNRKISNPFALERWLEARERRKRRKRRRK